MQLILWDTLNLWLMCGIRQVIIYREQKQESIAVGARPMPELQLLQSGSGFWTNYDNL